MSQLIHITTFGALKEVGYQPKSIREEMRDNLIEKLKKNVPIFDDIIGYETTVIPQIERAVLAGHSINFLGLRGQGKTKMARKMVELLDEYIPYVEGSEINDDPFNPLSNYAKSIIAEKADETPIKWLHRSKRYTEKLATPDVNVADLIGDLDPIKAANLRLSYADEKVIHFGLIPRSNRGIFVINELPDLQPRIQVALFNVLQERDIQIRGFKWRFPLDVQFIFTANPEDYTNRGAIITPLKDRIQSQIFTHYPNHIQIGRSITKQEVNLTPQQEKIYVPDLIELLIEQISIEARKSEYIDEKSGVSARLAISAYESLVSAVERRMILNNESEGAARISDLNAIIPAIVGKIEMVYEGEQEGAVNVAQRLVSTAIKGLAPHYFIGLSKESSATDIKTLFKEISLWFENGNEVDLINDSSQKDFESSLEKIPELRKTIETNDTIAKEETLLFMEYLLHVLAEYSLLDRKMLDHKFQFKDFFSSVMRGL